MTSHTADDGFHEIQLNGKQLVFLFMAATVVSVVIFLCGVLVGRGVRAERAAAVDTASLADSPLADASTASAPQAAEPVESDPRVAAPPPAVDELSYFNRLEKPLPPAEDLKPADPVVARTAPAAHPAPAARPPATRVSSPPAAASKPVPAPIVDRGPRPAATGSAGSSGYAVQLAALNSQGEAAAMVKRLAAKGYAAYVLTPSGGAPAIYRVRVGNYDSRREAESVAARLEKEGQFKPWVTR